MNQADGPKSSMPKKVAAMGVLARPPYKLTKPMAADNPKGNENQEAKPEAACEPIKNKGVASPPLNPRPKLKFVASNFQRAKSGATDVNGLSKNSEPSPIVS